MEKEECRTVPAEKCREISREVCTDVTTEECEQVPTEVCATLPREVCQVMGDRDDGDVMSAAECSQTGVHRPAQGAVRGGGEGVL